MTTPVLICDDSGFARKQMARSIPDGWDVSISFAGNGQEALDAIRAGKADVMFLDLNMPVMGGWEFLDELTENNYMTHFPNLKVIVLSSTIDPKDIEKSKSYPMVLDFLSKPITREMLEELKRN